MWKKVASFLKIGSYTCWYFSESLKTDSNIIKIQNYLVDLDKNTWNDQKVFLISRPIYSRHVSESCNTFSSFPCHNLLPIILHQLTWTSTRLIFNMWCAILSSSGAELILITKPLRKIDKKQLLYRPTKGGGRHQLILRASDSPC